VPTAAYPAINSFFVIALSPLLAIVWMRLHNHRWHLSIPLKFSLGLFFMGIGFLVIPIAIHLANANGMVWQGWVFVSYFFQTFGELCLSPIGLAMVTALAPANLTGMMMGVWFLTIAAGYAFGGHIADTASIPTNITDLHAIGVIYSHMFSRFGWIAVLVGILLALAAPRLKRLAM
jgi:POT family proton-dependent oligopeptide transporter